jgi:hypothetical protein
MIKSAITAYEYIEHRKILLIWNGISYILNLTRLAQDINWAIYPHRYKGNEHPHKSLAKCYSAHSWEASNSCSFIRGLGEFRFY